MRQRASQLERCGFNCRQSATHGLPERRRNRSDAFEVDFANNSLRNTWLKVTVLAANTGLAADDVFYFGNAVGEVNGSTSGSGLNIRYNVNTSDTSLVRGNQLFTGALVTNNFDFNKSGNVNTADTSIVRSNQSFTGILRQITGAAPSMRVKDSLDFSSPRKKELHPKRVRFVTIRR